MLYYIAGKEAIPGAPIRIKINSEKGNAILAFSNKEVGEEYLKIMNFSDECAIRSGSEMNEADFYGKGNLLMFHDMEEIESAYKDQSNYNWEQLLVYWPDE